MRRKSYKAMPCPIARGLDRVGDWWNILILRDLYSGFSRFEEIRESLGVSPAILTSRLKDLIAARLVERRQYNNRPPRYSYHLTPVGLDFQSVLIAMLAWGNRHFAPEGHSVDLFDNERGVPVDPAMIDPATGEPLTQRRYILTAGPAASGPTRRRYERLREIAAASGEHSQ